MVLTSEIESLRTTAGRLDTANLATLYFAGAIAIAIALVAFWSSRVNRNLRTLESTLGALKDEQLIRDLKDKDVEIQQAKNAARLLELRIEEEARKRAEAEESLERLRKKVAPRMISKTLEPLEKGAKGRAEILYQDDLPEAYRFARNLRLCLLASGWEVADPTPILPNPTQPHVPAAEAAGAGDTDVTISARWLESEPETTDTPYATLYKFFVANDLGLRCRQDPNLAPDLLRIVVGPK